MIPLAEIDATAKHFKVPVDTVEKDYAISWILACLSACRLKQNFVFYGGTAIKRIYFEDHRFSEDIDLVSSNRFSPNDILQELHILQKAQSEANLNLTVESDTIQANNHRVQLYVKYTGFDEIVGVPKKIRLDFVMKQEQFGDIVNKEILESYSDLKSIKVILPVMSLNTILANKLGLLTDITRNEPRDLYDIWFLLSRTAYFDFDFMRVCDVYKEKYGFHPSLNLLLPQLKNQGLRTHWNTRLSSQIADLPSIDTIISEVKEKLTLLYGDGL